MNSLRTSFHYQLPEISDYEASFLLEASEISTAVQGYLEQNSALITNELESSLRFKRNQYWLQAALASLHGHDSAQVCLFWSQAADRLLEVAFNECFQTQKIALFALGKLGSQELNLSSDVDILLVCDNEEFSWQSPLRRFQKLLAERNSLGFVFRVDFDLRPGGRNGPLVATLDQFKDYYGNYGETWERLAFVRLRGIAGDLELQNETLQFARKFTFRRHLDFTLLEDLKQLRHKIHSHYWERTQENQIDLKLGLGGIRDVELFVHALQVVHGGKDINLQVFSTQKALEQIALKKLLPADDVQFLQKHYWNLRKIENFVQALRDEQTHLLKTTDLFPEFIHEILPHLPNEMQHCDSLVGGLLGQAPSPAENYFNLEDLGVSSEVIKEHWNEILQQEVLSHTKDRDEASRLAFLKEFLFAMKAQKGDLNRGLVLLKDFIKATRAKATFFSMLLREKKLLAELAWLLGHSPYLSRILCHRPELLDSFVYRSQDKPSADWSLLLEELTEKKLLSEVINGSQFLRNQNILELVENLTSTADAIVEVLLERLRQDYPSNIKILALGKWGGREMGFRSDLDFIFVVPEEPNANDFKIAKRMISRLTDTHKGGAIYSIDMRLRPSGRAGPLVIQEKVLEDYLQNHSSAWERQAYLKARWIGREGPNLQALCLAHDLSQEEIFELERIRKELTNKATMTDLKYSPGGLVDIEFAAQILTLQKKTLPILEIPSTQTSAFFVGFGDSAEEIRLNYLRLRQIEQMLQLVASEALSKLDQNHESFPFLATALQTTPENLINEVNSKLHLNLQILNRLDPRRQTQ